MPSPDFIREYLVHLYWIKIPEYSLVGSPHRFIVLMVCSNNYFLWNHEIFEKKMKKKESRNEKYFSRASQSAAVFLFS